MTNEEEKLGRLIDRLENLSYALKLPMPPNLHVEQLSKALPEIVAEMKRSFIEITAEDPWS